jgi:hypothetical protein
MIKAIDGYLVEGVQTTLPFGNLFVNMKHSVLVILTHFCEKIL